MINECDLNFPPMERSEISYLDNNRNPVPKEQATMAIIREYDEHGDLVRETFGRIKGEAE